MKTTISKELEIELYKNLSKHSTLSLKPETHKIQPEMQKGELHQAQRKVDRLYQLYRYIYEHAPAGYLILEECDTSIIEANIVAARQLQLEQSSIINTIFTKYLAPEFADIFYICMKKALRNFNRETCEVKLRRREGYIWVLLDMSTIKDSHQVYMTMIDIDQYKETNAFMEKIIKDSIKKNRELSSQLLLVQEEERRRLAIDVHDHLGRSLTLLSILISRLRKPLNGEIGPILDEIDIQSKEMVHQIRNLSNSLSMHMLRDLGLSQALQDYFDKVWDSTELKINFLCNGLEPRPARIVEISIFRIIQEAITNILRHANTDECDVSIEAKGRTLNLRIEDRGAGFVMDLDKLNSIGMRGMRERAEILGARWVVESSPGKGTILTGEFPLATKIQ